MHRLYLSCLLVLSVAGFACSKSSEETRRSADNGNVAAVGDASSNSSVSANAEAQAVIPGIQGAGVEANQKRPEQYRSPGKSGTDTQAAEASSQAPDNSTFTSKLTDIAVETRSFKDHPLLLKVVKTIAPGKTELKVFLRNGKVIDVPADRIKDLSTIPAMDILSVVGMDPAPARPIAGKDDSGKH
jgi:hypothetical protein